MDVRWALLWGFVPIGRRLFGNIAQFCESMHSITKEEQSNNSKTPKVLLDVFLLLELRIRILEIYFFVFRPMARSVQALPSSKALLQTMPSRQVTQKDQIGVPRITHHKMYRPLPPLLRRIKGGRRKLKIWRWNRRRESKERRTKR